MKAALSASLFVLLLAAAAPAGQAPRFSFEEEQVLLTYQAALGRQQISGVSRTLSGGVEELAGGLLKVSARVPVQSFASGSPGVDALFALVLQADRFPQIEFEGQAKAGGKRSGQFSAQLEGTLSIHGVSQRVQTQLRVLRDRKTLYVTTSFAVDLAAFGLQAPSIGGVAVSPRVQIELHALLRPGEPAALAGAGAPRG